MKKTIITILIGMLLQLQPVYASQEAVQTLPQEVSQSDTVDSEKPIEEQEQSKGDGITTYDVIGVIATPIVVIGAVVAMIVVSPIWLAKKAFGSD